MAKYEQDVVQWITVHGNHIPIKPGQTIQEAISERFDDTGDIEIDIETEDLDKEIESDTLYYFGGYNPHEVTKEEYEKNKNNNKYYAEMQLTPEIKDLMKEMLAEESINELTKGQLVTKFDEKVRFYIQGAERRAVVSKFRNLLGKEYEKKAARVLKTIPKTSDNSPEYGLKQNANGYIESKNASYKSKEYKAYCWNCQRCVIAYEMRRRGYDVEADAYDEDDRLGYSHNNLKRSFLNFTDDMVHDYDRRPDGNLYSGKGQLFKAMESDMMKEPEGSRFILDWDWKGENSGHTVNAEKHNGNIIVYDSQNGKTHSFKEYLNLHSNIRPRTITWVKTNDLKLSGDLKGVVKWKH